jgi:DNA replication protein DnaC
LSQLPPVPEHLRALAPGYSAKQIQLDAEMCALGRPHLPIKALLNPKALAEYRAAVEAWEHANGEAAVRWLELNDAMEAEGKRLYEERYGPEAFAREQMRSCGFEGALVETALRELRDSACYHAARDWARDGTQWSLLLTGSPGCGKSQAATWAAYELLTRNGFAVRCVVCPKVSEGNLFDMAADLYRFRCSTAGVLVLDDLGEGEQRGEKRSAWRGWVDEVLTNRFRDRKKTIITTNRSPAVMRQWLGDRLADRLLEGTVFSTNEKSMRGAP